jgi:PilZ domain
MIRDYEHQQKTATECRHSGSKRLKPKMAVSTKSPIGMASQPAKRRSVLRCPLVASAEVTELGSGSSAKLSARISELGLGGCYIDTLNPFPEGTMVQLRILRDDGAFETRAKVVYSDLRFGMGVALIEMTPNQRSLLQGWIAQLVAQLKSSS